MKRRVTRAGLGAAFANLSFASLFLAFAWAHAQSFARCQRPSGPFLVAFEVLFALFFVARAPADARTSSPWAWASAAGGTFLPLLLRPLEAPQDVAAGEVLQLAGLLLATYGLLSLNTSVGVLPAHRGIKTTGAYRWLRHPLYAAYAVNAAGYLASNFTVRNLAIVLAASACQVGRIVNEERLLSRYAAYAEYKARTRWRVLPFVF